MASDVLYEEPDAYDEACVWRAREGHDPVLILSWRQLPGPARQYWQDIADALVRGGEDE